jgi:hypothetical protein
MSHTLDFPVVDHTHETVLMWRTVMCVSVALATLFQMWHVRRLFDQKMQQLQKQSPSGNTAAASSSATSLTSSTSSSSSSGNDGGGSVAALRRRLRLLDEWVCANNMSLSAASATNSNAQRTNKHHNGDEMNDRKTIEQKECEKTAATAKETRTRGRKNFFFLLCRFFLCEFDKFTRRDPFQTACESLSLAVLLATHAMAMMMMTMMT